MSGVPDKVDILRENILFYTPPSSEREVGPGAYSEIKFDEGEIRTFFWREVNISTRES